MSLRRIRLIPGRFPHRDSCRNSGPLDAGSDKPDPVAPGRAPGARVTGKGLVPMDGEKDPSHWWPNVERGTELALRIATAIIQLLNAVHGGR
jgi:hypothetical protein